MKHFIQFGKTLVGIFAILAFSASFALAQGNGNNGNGGGGGNGNGASPGSNGVTLPGSAQNNGQGWTNGQGHLNGNSNINLGCGCDAQFQAVLDQFSLPVYSNVQICNPTCTGFRLIWSAPNNGQMWTFGLNYAIDSNCNMYPVTRAVQLPGVVDCAAFD